MKLLVQVAISLAVLFFAVTVWAQKPIVYPAKGQSAGQQTKDDGECHVWAKQTTGIDPAVVASTPPPQQTGPAVGGGERVQGAARGALGGRLSAQLRVMQEMAPLLVRSWARQSVDAGRARIARNKMSRPLISSRISLIPTIGLLGRAWRDAVTRSSERL